MSIEELINKIVWWIPFKSLRNTVRSYLFYIGNLIITIHKTNTELNKKLEQLDLIINRSYYIENLIKNNNIKLPVHMSENEREVFVNAIKGSKNYIEFGSGGSTFITLKTTDAKIISIEGDPNWLEYMRNNDLIFESEQSCRLKFYYIDIGKVGDWSIPIDDSSKELYPNYSQYVFNILTDNEMNNIDTVFIDGRFRVASALNAIYYCRNAKIIIHDFFNREYYHILLDYLDIVEKSDTLGVFKIKNNIDYDKVKELVNLYCYDKR